MKQEIRQSIQKAIGKLYPGIEADYRVEFAPVNVDADFSSNVAMILAKKLKKKPMEVAQEIGRASCRERV